MLANDYQRRTPLKIVLDIDNGIYSKTDVSTMKRVLLVPECSVIISLIDIIHCILEFINEFGESVFVESLLQFIQKYFRIFRLC